MSLWNWKVGGGVIVLAFVAGVIIGSVGLKKNSHLVSSSDSDTWSNPLQPAYIDDVGCAQCHPGQVADHAGSGHAQTFHSGDLAEQFEMLRDRSFRDEERGGTFTFRADGRQLVAEFENGTRRERLPIPFALGSGTHATTLISLLTSESGEPTVLEHRVSYFATDRRLGVTPGQAGLIEAEPVDCLGRVYRGREATNCIGCHTTTAKIRGRELHDVRANVGCESCHGPGRGHAAAMEANRPGHEISSDKGIRLAKGTVSSAEEIQLCGKCHRTPEMLPAPPSIADPKIARFQPVGLLNSKCYKRAEGRLRCTTCHDPHRTVDRVSENYVATCLACHSQSDAGDKPCPQSPKEKCVSCHMPEVEVHPGISFHDHWIRVRQPADERH